jgi:Na+/proline symporter
VELTKIFGLPAHPLLVHAPVLLIPLCAIGAIWIVVSPTWRHRIGWIVVVLSGVAVVASQLAAGSGEALQEALKSESELVETHAELGDTFFRFALAFFLAVLALMVWDTMQRRKAAVAGEDPDLRRLGRSGAAIVLGILVVVTAAGATYRVYQVGHSGAKSVWEEESSRLDWSGSGETEETEGMASRGALRLVAPAAVR